jgi:hypothetical protein
MRFSFNRVFLGPPDIDESDAIAGSEAVLQFGQLRFVCTKPAEHLDGADKVGRVDLAEALSYRALTDDIRRADRSSARSKRRHLLQQLSRRCLLLAHLRKVRGSLRRHRHLLGEFRPGGEFLRPRIHVWVQLGERIAGKRQPVGIDEPGDIENRQLVAEQVRLRRQALVERVEFGAEGLCRLVESLPSSRESAMKRFCGRAKIH